MIISTPLTSIGLACDILGALILAVPDVPLLAQRFDFGRLRRAREKMEAEGVQPGDVGFDSLLASIEETESVDQASADDIGNDVQEIVIDRRTGLAASNIDFHWGEEYVEARYEPDGDYNEADFYDTGEVYRGIRKKVDVKATKVRLAGLILLAGGFTLQFIATLV